MKRKEVIITVAPSSNFHGKDANPNLPEQPEEIANATYDCYNAGASIVHIHARDKNGVQTNDVEVFKEINSLVRSKCDIIIQNSIAPALKPGSNGDPYDGLQTLDALPEMASLDVGIACINQKDRELIIPWTYNFLKKAAELMLEKGIKPELEIANNSNFELVYRLINDNVLTKPYCFNFIMGMNRVNQCAVPFTAKHLMHYLDLLPEDSYFSTMGIGNVQLPATMFSVLVGGNVRVGFEDNIYFSKGQLAASNAQLVERIAKWIRELELEVATPERAREILGIPQLKK